MNKNVLTIRLPEDLKIKIEKIAEEQGVSMNQFALYAFTRQISELETHDYFEKYLANKNKKEIYNNFDEAMSAVKERDIPEWDQKH